MISSLSLTKVETMELVYRVATIRFLILFSMFPAIFCWRELAGTDRNWWLQVWVKHFSGEFFWGNSIFNPYQKHIVERGEGIPGEIWKSLRGNTKKKNNGRKRKIYILVTDNVISKQKYMHYQEELFWNMSYYIQH